MLVIWEYRVCVVYNKLALECSHKLFCVLRPPMGYHKVGIVHACTAPEGSHRIQSCLDSEGNIVVISSEGVSTDNDLAPVV